ncbi:MAG: Rossmann-like and DUF2520 domain-containing protein [Methanosarcina sp.]
MDRYNISFAGAGRVGAALCLEMFSIGYNIDLIVSESDTRGKTLAGSCNSRWSSSLDFPEESDLIIVAVPDHRLAAVLADIKCSSHTLVAHTAGSYGLDVFPETIVKKGVFYPLQTFSPGRNITFRDLPVFVEASDEESLSFLREAGTSIGGNVHTASLEQRRMLHVSAVFASNFTNHLLTQSREIARMAGFDLDILYPLITETISKAVEKGPENSQTGPAVRNDRNTIEKHLQLLSYSPELQEIYKELTNSIINYYNKN